MSRRTGVILVAAAVVILGVWAWRFWWPDDERQIARRLSALVADFNESTTDGVGTLARASRIGAYFTDDIVVELGQGSPPIRGRETLLGMAVRLQPRTSAFTLKVVDVNVTLTTASTADVNLTVAFQRRNLETGEESIEAQEMALRMVKAGGDWRISHIRTVEVFR
jgi:hypothetical protein